MIRRSAARALALALALAAAGCVTVGAGGDAPAFTFYSLEDLAAATQGERAARKIDHVLLVSGPPSSPFYDTTSLAYSRAPGARAYYQFSGWTERPARRIAQLAERRLIARGSFDGVASVTAGVRGDLLLNLNLEHLYHDATREPGSARLMLVAEMVDWRTRALLDRQVFEYRVPVEQSSAAAAVAGLSRAVTLLLDDLVPWVERAAAAAPRNAP
ncbi:MAG TPA: ABC-type transport auxiliary lipoprotein family protein [Burkholderiaceae bacterium]|nr:ABC-type transport auxiliary lipoprotein family protein [Burkholderiaceae bacterium]